MTVFISYSSKFKPEISESLRDELENGNFEIWKDVKNLRGKGGINYIMEISNAIRENDIFLCLLSNEYFKSKICQDELLTAYYRNRKILPVLLEPIVPDYPPNGFELALCPIQYINVENKNFNDVVKEINDSIHNLLGSVQHASQIIQNDAVSVAGIINSFDVKNKINEPVKKSEIKTTWSAVYKKQSTKVPSNITPINGDKCYECFRTIYPNDSRIKPLNEQIYFHLSCFKCVICQTTLNKNTFKLIQKQKFCCKNECQKTYKIQDDEDVGVPKLFEKPRNTRTSFRLPNKTSNDGGRITSLVEIQKNYKNLSCEDDCQRINKNEDEEHVVEKLKKGFMYRSLRLPKKTSNDGGRITPFAEIQKNVKNESKKYEISLRDIFRNKIKENNNK